MSLLTAVTVLIFLVTPSKCSVICSEKYALYLGKFWSCVWSVPGALFCLPLIAKRCAGDEDEKKLLQNDDVISQVQVVCTNVLAIIIIFFLKINESKSGNIFFIHMLHTVHYVVVYYSQCNLDMLPQWLAFSFFDWQA